MNPRDPFVSASPAPPHRALIFIYVHGCFVYMYTSVTRECLVPAGETEGVRSPITEFQKVVSHHVRDEPGSSRRTVKALKC